MRALALILAALLPAPCFGAPNVDRMPAAAEDVSAPERFTLTLDTASDSLASLGSTATQSRTRQEALDIAARIRDRLLARGDIASSVRLVFAPGSGQDPGSASISVNRGRPPARVEAVVTGGEDVVPHAAAVFQGANGGRADPVRVLAGLEALRAAAERQGRYAAEASLDSAVLLDPESARLYVSLRPGAPITLDSLDLKGATLRPSVAASVSGLTKGRTLTPEVLEEARGRLQASELFASVGEISLVPAAEPGRARVVVPVVESRLNRFEGALGMEQGGGLTGKIDLALGNIGGTGRSAGARWAGLGQGRSEYAARYREPSLFGKPIDGSLALEAQVFDSLYTQTQWSLDLSGHPAPPLRASGGIQRSGSTYTGAGRGTSSTWSLQGAFGWRGFDDPVNPIRGFALGLDGEVGRRSDSYPGYSTSRRGLYRGTAQAEGALPTGRARALYASVRGSLVRMGSGSLPAEELLFAGGSEGLRGHRDREFAGDRILVGTLEHRWITDARGGRAYLFVDGARHDLGGDVEAGSARGSLNGSLARTVLSPGSDFGYGAGLRSPTRAGTFGIELGLAPGAPLREGKLHLRYSTDW